jgi:hypothetical protein
VACKAVDVVFNPWVIKQSLQHRPFQAGVSQPSPQRWPHVRHSSLVWARAGCGSGAHLGDAGDGALP